MSASQSNLSDPKFGYDLVVAVTQASVDVTMKQFLATLASPELVRCYQYDATNAIVPIDYDTLKTNAKGSDPFAVADGADPSTNQDLINLTNANFAGAYRARLGLPDMPLSDLPPVLTLAAGTDAPAGYNLLCSEFVVALFDYGPRGKTTWVNQSQPTGSGTTPWYFSATVSLNPAPYDPTVPGVPQEVQQNIAKLTAAAGPDAFSVQRLLVDLDTVVLESAPALVGVPDGSAVGTLIGSEFLGSYVAQMRLNGTPVLGYTFQMTQPDPSTLQLGAIARECCALLDANGNPIASPTPAQERATTLVYLGTTATTAPTAVQFPWNWVELGEVSQIAGVLAVRRDVFLDFLAGLLDLGVAPLCRATNVSMTNDGTKFEILYSSPVDSNPSRFQRVTTGAADADGYTQILSLAYSHSSHGDSAVSLPSASIAGDFDYALTGTVAVQGNQLRIVLHAQAYMEFEHKELFVSYTDLPGQNYYDKTLTVVYQLGVTDAGVLQVTATDSPPVDDSAAWAFKAQGLLASAESQVQTGLQQMEGQLASALDQAFTSFVDALTNAIDSCHAWVFPGGSTFVFHQIAFSNALDLVAQLTYAAPSATPSLASTLDAQAVAR